LNPIEEAAGLKRLIDEFQAHAEEVAGPRRSRAGVTNLLRLLELGPRSSDVLQDGASTWPRARAPRAFKARRSSRHQIATRACRCANRGWQQARGGPAASARRSLDPTAPPAGRARESLGATVHLKPRATAGVGVIDYSSLTSSRDS
jgi:ParB family chromosome partitioning protein